MTIKLPTNTRALVLYYLITRSSISERDTLLNGFRARVSELRDEGLNIKDREVTFTNRFGRSSKVKERYLEEQDRTFALELYERVNKDNRSRK